MTGRGKMTYRDGGIYVGEWLDGLKNGEGRCTASDGSHYEGRFKKDKKHGYGEQSLVKQPGEMIAVSYKGNWENDKRHGSGREVFSTGEVYDGDWHQD